MQEWFVYFQRVNLPELKCYMGADAALKGRCDKTVVVIGVHPDSTIDVLDYWAGKGSDLEFFNAIIDFDRAYNPALLGFEDVLFQEVLKDNLIKHALSLGITLPCRGVKPGRASKEMRFRTLAPLVENGILRFKVGQKKLINLQRIWENYNPKG